jgi:hypothetical protein
VPARRRRRLVRQDRPCQRRAGTPTAAAPAHRPLRTPAPYRTAPAGPASGSHTGTRRDQYIHVRGRHRIPAYLRWRLVTSGEVRHVHHRVTRPRHRRLHRRHKRPICRISAQFRGVADEHPSGRRARHHAPAIHEPGNTRSSRQPTTLHHKATSISNQGRRTRITSTIGDTQTTCQLN